MQVIDNYVPITQAKSKLLDMVRSIQDKDDTFTITKNGVPEAVLISAHKFEGLHETIEILADPVAMAQVRGSVDDVKHGRLIDADEVL